ncbi:MAG: DUF6868 family protein [Methyloligellaceae bacterium]
MSLQKFKSVLLWCTIINFIILLVATFGTLGPFRFGLEWHASLFNISADAVNIAVYAFLGALKLLWIFFNLVPYVVLKIVGTE